MLDRATTLLHQEKLCAASELFDKILVDSPDNAKALLGNAQPIPFQRFDHTFYAMAFLGIVPVVVIGLFYPKGSQTPP